MGTSVNKVCELLLLCTPQEVASIQEFILTNRLAEDSRAQAPNSTSLAAALEKSKFKDSGQHKRLLYLLSKKGGEEFTASVREAFGTGVLTSTLPYTIVLDAVYVFCHKRGITNTNAIACLVRDWRRAFETQFPGYLAAGLSSAILKQHG